MRVSVNLDRAKAKLGNAAVERGRYAFANQSLADMSQFVPKDESILVQTGHVSSDGTELIWNTPYAARMFYMYMYNYTTPGTGPRWDVKASRIFMSDWINAFVKGADW